MELPVELAEQKGIANGGRVKVRSKRGEVVGVAIVSKRMRPLKVGDGKVVYQIGIPVHWHFAAGKGTERPTGSSARRRRWPTSSRPTWGTPTFARPEFKGFLVDIEKA